VKKILIAALAATALTTTARADEKLDMAIKLLAAGTFVDNYCSGMSPNVMLLNAAVEKLGVNVERLKKNTGKLVQGQLYVEVLKKDTKLGCKTMWELFGDEGTSLPGIIEKD
jgi:hypothetical protein